MLGAWLYRAAVLGDEVGQVLATVRPQLPQGRHLPPKSFTSSRRPPMLQQAPWKAQGYLACRSRNLHVASQLLQQGEEFDKVRVLRAVQHAQPLRDDRAAEQIR